MTVPRQADLHRPVLEIVAEAQGSIAHRRIMQEVIVRFGLSEEDQLERTSSGAVRLNTNVSYAEQYLMNAGLLVRPARGTWAISPKGRAYLVEHHGSISIAQLKELEDGTPPEIGGQASPRFTETRPTAANRTTPQMTNSGPGEMMETGYQQMQRDLVREIIDSVVNLTPDQFERLVVHVMVNMGYGEGESVGRSGDGGIDGIITRDPLGLDKIYLQAKRWSSQVGEPEIRNFSGSLDAQGASIGVFITTSTFSGTARQTAANISSGDKFIRLVDGNELAHLMIRHGVGVVTEHTYEIKKLDENYFAEEI